MNIYNTRITLSGRVLFTYLGLTDCILAMIEANSESEVKEKAQKFCKEKYGLDVIFADPILSKRSRAEIASGELLIT